MRYPVVIVGGGLAGVFTAYAFAAAGVGVALVEAGRLGQGGAGRGPGILQGEAAASYRDVEARHGRRAARAVFEASRRAVRELAAASRRLAIPQVETHDALRVLAGYDADERLLQKDVALRRDAGLDVVWLKPQALAREVRVDVNRGGVRLRDWGQANPSRLLTAFAAGAVARGAAFFERSPVRRVKPQRRHVEVHTARGVLSAETVIVCTGEPTDLFRPLKRHFSVTERYVVLTERVPANIRKQITTKARVLTDTETPPHFIRWLADGRMVIAGADQAPPTPRAREKVIVQRTGQLMYELSRLFPPLSGIRPLYGWGLPLATAADGVLVAGPHRNFPRHLFAWGTRHDPAQAFLASRILLRRFLGREDKSDAYFAFTRG